MLINQQEHHGILVSTMRMEINAYATHGNSHAMSALYSGLAPGREMDVNGRVWPGWDGWLHSLKGQRKAKKLDGT